MYEIVLKSDNFSSLLPLDFIKQYLKVDGDDDDQIIAMHINFAEIYAAKMCNISVSPKQYIIKTNTVNAQCTIPINMKPLISVDGIIVDGKALDASDYQVTEDSVVILNNAGKNYSITCTCGYSALTVVPSDLQTALLTHVSYRYENRSGDKTTLAPILVDSVYLSYRRCYVC